jgi:chromosome segregation ATPase
MEAVLREKESIWLKERVAIMERMTALESTLELERKNFTTNQIDGKALLAEIDVLKKQLSEATQKHIDAQAELLRALNAIEELKISMLECENQLMETRARIQSLLADLKVRDDEIKSLHDNVDIERKKVMEGLLQLEKEKCLVDKLNFEKDAMEKLHQNLQKEIERTQTEAHNFSLEVEKLLASLGSVFDQISSDPNPLRDPNTPFFFVTPMLSGSAISDKNNAPQAERVEYAIKRLSDMRIWCRDELRTRRVLEERYETVQREVAASQITINDNQNEIKRLQTRCNNVEGEIKVKVKEINEMQSAIAFKEEELERMKHVLRLALVKFHLK